MPPPTPTPYRFRRATSLGIAPLRASDAAGPRNAPVLRAILLAFLVLHGVASANAARNPDPPQRLPLTPFGFQTTPDRFLLDGATMFTVDFVDKTHLLVTFGVSRLMPRLPDCPPDDADRTVKAVLVELPSGREVASTEWRLHDYGQYLWNVGEGHFILRNRGTLTTFAPFQNLAAPSVAAPFVQQPFLSFKRTIEAILISADHDLIAIETTKPRTKAAPIPMLQVQAQAPAASSPVAATPSPGLLRRDATVQRDRDPVEITFIRLLHVKATEADASLNGKRLPSVQQTEVPAGPTRLVGALAARIRSDKAVNIPLTTEGFLETRAESRDGVLFHFVTYAGKDIDLGDFPTSCHPRPTFVSHSEFVTYGCRGADESLDLAGFNLRGDMIWQINFTDTQAYPSFASAPAAGRFAFSRTITTSNVFGSETPSMSQLTAQEIRVIQMYNGRQLLRAVASPIQRAGQNYALSPDGLTLAVVHDVPVPREGKPVHDPAIEIFNLPALSPKDLSEIRTEAAMAPPSSDVPMRFSLKEIKEALDPRPAGKEVNSAADESIAGDPIPAAEDTSGAKTAAGRIVGDQESTSAGAVKSEQIKPEMAPVQQTTPNEPSEAEKPRKPPTLYGPDEVPPKKPGL